ncbi:hypothetical protein, partial [Actinomadura sp. KC345]|uniref:hypothetical protein n=1 Tax=Actinomadura sp. KC345 TaxID=2530371 RepID=UPI001A9DE9A5
ECRQGWSAAQRRSSSCWCSRRPCRVRHRWCAGSPWSALLRPGPVLWIGAPLLLAGGVALIFLLLMRTRRPR